MSQSARKAHTRRKFTDEEDAKIKKLVAEHGEFCWNLIAMNVPGRTPRQCRERYNNNLKPNYINAEWTFEEDTSLYIKYMELGPQWTLISRFFNGRSPSSIKNRWNYYISKQMTKFFLHCLNKKSDNDLNDEQKIELKKKEKF